MSPAPIKKLAHAFALPVEVKAAEKRLQRRRQVVVGGGRAVRDAVRLGVARAAEHLLLALGQAVHNGARGRGLRGRADKLHGTVMQPLSRELLSAQARAHEQLEHGIAHVHQRKAGKLSLIHI